MTTQVLPSRPGNITPRLVYPPPILAGSADAAEIEKALHCPTSLPFNRVRAIALHLPRYGFCLQERLARDTGLAHTTVGRLLRGVSRPSLPTALRLAAALSVHLGRRLPLNEVFSLNGAYPTASACELCSCRGCLPPEAYDDEDNLRPEFQGPNAKNWSVSPTSVTKED